MNAQTSAPAASAPYQPPRNPCTRCELRTTTLAEGKCAPGDACLFVDNGRQIDRFLQRNREWAELCLHDPFWERRAIAAKWAPVEAVHVLINDSDETVRRSVASRLDGEALARMAHDSDREVRVTVASRLPPSALTRMMRDPDYAVRLQVARRLPHGRLPHMANDPDPVIRKEVARRLPPFALGRMARDPDPEVRAIA
ncbi:MAG: 4Fe4S-binding leucine-rich repeat protein, partial [Rhodocyclaceae bacterium]|nr:4Fe4S-binding leucine-rich repeat protein [Rhodocyclaceae bacterium]